MFGYLEEFLKNAKLMADQELTAVPGTAVNPTLLEFSLLIIHCIEVGHQMSDTNVHLCLYVTKRFVDSLIIISTDRHH